MVMMARYCVNLPCFGIRDIYIFEEFGGRGGGL